MKKVLVTILIVLYAIFAISVTILLLSYNEYNCSVIGDNTLYIVKDESLEPRYQKGDLLIIKKSIDKNINIDDELIMYQVITSEEYQLVTGKLTRKTQQGRNITYTLEEQGNFDSSYLVGRTKDVKVIHNLGTFLSIFESKWGYLFSVVIVSLLLFLQELFDLFVEIRYGIQESKKAKRKEEMELAKAYAANNIETEEYIEETEEIEKPKVRKTNSTTPKKKTTNTTKTAETTGTTRKTTTKKTTTTTKSASKKTSEGTVEKKKTAGTTKKTAAPKKVTKKQEEE